MTKKKHKIKKDVEENDDFFLLEEVEDRPEGDRPLGGDDVDDKLIEELDDDERNENNDQVNLPVLLEDSDDDEWIDEEGELTIDVYQDNANIYIKSPIPGVEADDVDISIDNDMVTIKAKRDWSHEVDEDDYFFKENYWGSISRSIILPVAIKEDKVDAAIKNGILIVTLPKDQTKKGTNIRVKNQD